MRIATFRSSLSIMALWLAVVLVAIGCGGGGSGSGGNVLTKTITLVSVTPPTATLPPGGSTKFIAVVAGTGDYSQLVDWKASGGTIKDGFYTAPATAGTYTVTATSLQDPTKSASATVSISRSPTISSFAPTQGAPGTTVTVTGTGLTGVTSVKFNGVLSSSSTVTSDTSMTAVVPTGATTGGITVANQAGSATSSSNFTVLTAPTITSFTPTLGLPLTTVTLTGSGFTGATAVNFNGTLASNYYINSNTSLTAVVPIGTTTGKISVTNPVGTGISSSNFTVLALPAITTFSPAMGAIGTTLTLAGTGFTGTTAVRFNGISASTFMATSDTTLTAVVPPGATTGAITVTNQVGSAASSTNFTVLAVPAIGSFSPTLGAVGTAVTLTGTNLLSSTSVKFNGITASTFAANSDTSLIAVVPVGATTGPIMVTNSAGTGTSPTSFIVQTAAPTISSFTPASGAVGTTVTLTGTNFSGASLVMFNLVPAAYSVVSNTSITATVPSGASTGTITVTNALGTGTSATSFTVIPLPTITTFSPTSGAPGTTVTLTGTGFTGASVTFSGILASFIGVISDTSMTAVVPIGASTGAIGVTNMAGSGISSNFFTVLTAPTINSFSPTQGVLGTTVTLAGSGFTGASAVQFNGTSASFTVLSNTSLTTVVPTGATTGPITVTNQTGSGISPSNFTVLGVPQITSFTPNSAPVGTTVTLAGSRFTGVTAVKFNGTAAGSYSLNSDSLMTAVVPTGATTGLITVSNLYGTGTSTSTFTVSAGPGITSFTPISGVAGTTVTITCTDTTGLTSVKFNGISANYTIVSSTSIRAVVPSTASTGAITMTTSSGLATSSTSFVVLTAVPTLSSFTPTSGSIGSMVTLTGNNFTGATTVYFNGTSAGFTVGSNTSITAIVPSGATTGTITVANALGNGTNFSNFTVLTVLTITSHSPASGLVGSTVTLTGTGFTGTTAVRFNGTPATYTVLSDTSILATVPVGATTGTLTVTNSLGTVTSPLSFTVLAIPTISSFTPTSAAVGATVTLTGTGFTGVTSVNFSGTPAAFAVLSNTSIAAVVPSGATTGTITVTNPTGSGTSSGTFTVLTIPIISSISPSAGVVGGTVTLTGTGFAGITAVRFNGTAASNFGYSVNLMTVTVPTGATTGTITVTNALGTGTSTAIFTVLTAAPTISSFTPTSGGVGGTVTITGTNFSGASLVRFNSVSAVYSIISNTSITATVPSGASTGVISVTNALGTGTSSGVFSVLTAPWVGSFTPTSGAVGTSVVLTGTSFTGATSVTFNGTSGTYTVVSSTSIAATVPIGATSGTIAVTTPGGTGISSSIYTVLTLPTVNSFTPISGAVGAAVTLTGSGFAGVTSVKFNGTSAVYSILSNTSMTATVPYGATTGTITVTNALGTGSSSGVFNIYTGPTITSFTPTSGVVGTTVNLTGTGFTGTTSVKFNGTSASYSIVSDTSITVTVPTGATSGAITVTNPGGTGTSLSSFNINNSYVYRISLRWTSSIDLDTHWYGPSGNGGIFHVYYGNYNDPSAVNPNTYLAGDSSYGVTGETTYLLNQLPGTYTFCAHDFMNQSVLTSTALGSSGATVTLYDNVGVILRTFTVPSGVGTLWKVFTLSGATVTSVNSLSFANPGALPTAAGTQVEASLAPTPSGIYGVIGGSPNAPMMGHKGLDLSQATVTRDGMRVASSRIQPGVVLASVARQGVTGLEEPTILTAQLTTAFLGVVEDVDMSRAAVTVNGQGIRLNALTQISQETQDASFADLVLANLAPSDPVRIYGTFQSDGGFLASRIERRSLGVDDGQRVITGKATKLDPTAKTLMLGDWKVTYLDATTDCLPVEGQALQARGVATGNQLKAGSINGLRQDDGIARKAHLRGPATNINIEAQTFEVLGYEVRVNASTPLNQLSEGAVVEVEGKIAQGQPGVIYSLSMETEVGSSNRHGSGRSDHQARGPISSLDFDRLTLNVAGRSFWMDGATLIIHKDRLVGIDQLGRGGNVSVVGDSSRMDNQGNIFASRVVVLP
jgi:Domain of unknown function (DUF5666)/IPT/TIG domain